MPFLNLSEFRRIHKLQDGKVGVKSLVLSHMAYVYGLRAASKRALASETDVIRSFFMGGVMGVRFNGAGCLIGKSGNHPYPLVICYIAMV